jgi:hypothetical protein
MHEGITASPMLNEEQGFVGWMISGGQPSMPDTHYQEAFAA